MNKVIVKSKAVKAKKVTKPVKAINIRDKDHLHKIFSFYHNKFVSTSEIDAYCITNSLDRTYLGLADGTFYKTVSKNSPSYLSLQKLGILNKDGKDSYANHLVIPTLEGMQVISLEFVDLNEIKQSAAKGEGGKAPCSLLPLSKDSFRVDINGRLYILSSLAKSSYQLKATVKLRSGRFHHVDVINFYSSGNRKRLLRDICELFMYPHEDIRADILKLMELCENYETDMNPELSVHANELLCYLSENKLAEVSSGAVEDALLWNQTKSHRAIKELCATGMLQKVVNTRPIRYRVVEIMNKLSVDLQ